MQTPDSAIIDRNRHNSIDRAFLRGVAWVGSVKWIIQVVSWATTLVLVRLLTPSDYGLVGMASAYLGFLSIINELGLGSAVIVFRTLDNKQLEQLNTISILTGFLFFLISCLLAAPVAAFYRTPELARVIVIMSSSYIISAFKVVPSALLSRDLKFRLLSIAEAVQVLSQSILMIILALLHFGYWTLVIGSLASIFVPTGILVKSRFVKYRIPSLQTLRPALSYSSHVLVSRICWYIQSNADFAVAGRLFGKAVLGPYTFAWDLASVPVNKISSTIGQITPSYFSSLQNDLNSLGNRFLRITESLSLVTFPISVGIAFVAEDFVHVALGPEWIGAIVPLRLLGLYAAFRSISALPPQILFVTGESKFQMNMSILSAIVLPIAFVIGSRWGIEGIAWIWIIAYPPLTLPIFALSLKRMQLKPQQYFESVKPALWGCIAIIAFVSLSKVITVDSHAVRLALQVTVGAVAYIMCLFFLSRDRLVEIYRYLRSGVKG